MNLLSEDVCNTSFVQSVFTTWNELGSSDGNESSDDIRKLFNLPIRLFLDIRVIDLPEKRPQFCIAKLSHMSIR